MCITIVNKFFESWMSESVWAIRALKPLYFSSCGRKYNKSEKIDGFVFLLITIFHQELENECPILFELNGEHVNVRHPISSWPSINVRNLFHGLSVALYNFQALSPRAAFINWFTNELNLYSLIIWEQNWKKHNER